MFIFVSVYIYIIYLKISFVCVAAKRAFVELGEYLQRARRNDYWDTFSLYLENTVEDPALKDKELANKLAENRTEGDTNLAAVFEKYTKKQEEAKEQITDNETATEEESEDESDTDNESKDTLSIDTSSENNDEEDVKETIQENVLPARTENENNMYVVNVGKDRDKIISNKVEDVLKKECSEKIEIKTSAKENGAAVPENENNTTSSTAVNSKKITKTDVNTNEHSLQIPTINCTDIIDRIGGL